MKPPLLTPVPNDHTRLAGEQRACYRAILGVVTFAASRIVECGDDEARVRDNYGTAIERIDGIVIGSRKMADRLFIIGAPPPALCNSSD